jgi:SAM-dependent methyltransferase
MCNVPGVYTLVECDRCGFLYLSPRPDAEEIKRHYPEEYPFYASFFDQSSYIKSIGVYELTKRAQQVLDAVSGGHDVLDIGCAVGDFLSMMSSKGWNVRGVEPDPGAAAYARKRHGIDVFNGYLEEASFEPESFDAVTMWEVLEHTPQPLDTLRRAFDLLRPGGAIVMSVPNRDSLESKVFGTYWIGNDFPRHFSVFSPKHMRVALSSAGFVEPRIISQRGRLGAMHNEIACGLGSIDLWLHAGDRDRGARRIADRVLLPIVTKPVGVVPIFIASLPMSVAIRKLNLGSQMIAVAHKPAA